MSKDALLLTDGIFARMRRAVEKVEERLRRASSALRAANVPFAVVGGNAVAAWVGSIDESAVRNTRDVDLMVDRTQFDRVRTALESVGFVYRHTGGIDVFLDSPEAKVRDAVHVVFAGEMVRPGEPCPNPTLDDVKELRGIPALGLEALVQIKLTAWRDKDRTHIRDLIEVGLIDESWPARLPVPLGDRLQRLLDDPEG